MPNNIADEITEGVHPSHIKKLKNKYGSKLTWYLIRIGMYVGLFAIILLLLGGFFSSFTYFLIKFKLFIAAF
jgi:hypothetical protein